MKKVLFAAVALLASFAAGAAPLTQNFVADNGKVFQINHVLSVEKVPGFVNVKQALGTVHPFPDATGAVFQKVRTSPGFDASFVRVPGTDRYMKTTGTSEISCVSSQTVFAYPSQAPAEWFADGCQLHSVVKASAN
jgi:hypothetical protein